MPPEERAREQALNTAAHAAARAHAAVRAHEAAQRRAARAGPEKYWAAYPGLMPTDAQLSEFERDAAMARVFFWAQSGFNGAFSKWDGMTNEELLAEQPCACAGRGACGCPPTLAEALKQECDVPPAVVVERMRAYASAMSPSTPRAVCACCVIADIPIAPIPAAVIDGVEYPASWVDAVAMNVVSFVRYGPEPPGPGAAPPPPPPVGVPARTLARPALSLDDPRLTLLQYTADRYAAYDADQPFHIVPSAENKALWQGVGGRPGFRDIASMLKVRNPAVVPADPAVVCVQALLAARGRGMSDEAAAAYAAAAAADAQHRARPHHMWHIDGHYVEVDEAARTVSLWLCNTCDASLATREIPTISIAAGCDLGHPEVVGLPGLSAVEELCVQRRRVLGCALKVRIARPVGTAYPPTRGHSIVFATPSALVCSQQMPSADFAGEAVTVVVEGPAGAVRSRLGIMRAEPERVWHSCVHLERRRYIPPPSLLIRERSWV